MRKFGRIMARIWIIIGITLVAVFLALYIMLVQFKAGPSESAKKLFITTILETGQMKFLARWVCSEEEIAEIVEGNKMQAMDDDVDTSLINIKPAKESESVTVDIPTSDPEVDQPTNVPGTEETEPPAETEAPTEPAPQEVWDANGIRLEEISGRTFSAKMLIIKNPAQVQVASTYPWGDVGQELDILINNAGAVAGINGGLYVSKGNTGGKPMGVVVQHGQIIYNSPWGIAGLYLIGFNNDNILIVKNLDGWSPAQIEEYIVSAGIRDAVSFQDEASDSNNHFVPIVINGEPRKLDGQGSGANPRTVIGQRSDGAVLLLVTDGRGTSGHLGATASDLIDIMLKYGAVNAANLDGGSSSTMVYNGNWEMTSVTFYFQSTSWKLPTAFAVMPAM